MSMSMPRQVSAILCEDVRQEINGKLILIGAFTGRMAVPQFPFVAKLCGVLKINTPVELDRTITIVVSGRNSGAEFARAEFVLDASMVSGAAFELEETFLVMPPFPAPLSGPDILEVFASVGDEEPACAATLHVVKGAAPQATWEVPPP
jgi:hypothetical protein